MRIWNRSIYYLQENSKVTGNSSSSTSLDPSLRNFRHIGANWPSLKVTLEGTKWMPSPRLGLVLDVFGPEPCHVLPLWTPAPPALQITMEILRSSGSRPSIFAAWYINLKRSRSKNWLALPTLPSPHRCDVSTYSRGPISGVISSSASQSVMTSSGIKLKYAESRWNTNGPPVGGFAQT